MVEIARDDRNDRSDLGYRNCWKIKEELILAPEGEVIPGENELILIDVLHPLQGFEDSTLLRVGCHCMPFSRSHTASSR